MKILNFEKARFSLKILGSQVGYSGSMSLSEAKLKAFNFEGFGIRSSVWALYRQALWHKSSPELEQLGSSKRKISEEKTCGERKKFGKAYRAFPLPPKVWSPKSSNLELLRRRELATSCALKLFSLLLAVHTVWHTETPGILVQESWYRISGKIGIYRKSFEPPFCPKQKLLGQ